MTLSYRALMFGCAAGVGFGGTALALVLTTGADMPLTLFFAGACAGTGTLGLLMSRCHATFWKAAQREFAFDMVCMEESARLRIYEGTKRAFMKLRAEGVITDALTPEEFIQQVHWQHRRKADGASN